MTFMPASHSYACATATRRSFTVNGLTLRALEWGTPGRPVLCFLHGGSAHAHWWDAVAPAFADRYHVLALDQRGHGESDWPSPPAEGTAYATADFVSDLRELMDAVGCERMSLCGHSMGGHNSMAFAAWHPERVHRLIVVDSRPSMSPERLEHMHRRGHQGLFRYASLELAVERFRLIPRDTVADPALLDHLARQGIVQRDGRFVYRFDPACNGARRPTDVLPLLPGITAPTLLVRGERSPVLPRATAEEIARRIPRARLEEIPGAYHHLVLDQPAAFTALLDHFLTETRD